MKTLLSLFIYAFTYLQALIMFNIAVSKSIKLNKVIKSIFLLCTILVLSLFSGLRYETGRDYYSYIRNFDLIVSGFESRLEVGFQYINKFVGWLGFSSQFLLFISAFITMVFIVSSLYRKRNSFSVVIGLFVFLLLFYQSSFNVIRLMIAVSITFYNIKNIENKKIFSFTILTLLAGSFHTSAFVMFPMYFVYNYFILQKGVWKKTLLYIATILVIVNFNLIVQGIISLFKSEQLQYYTKYTLLDGASFSLEALYQTLFYFPLSLIGLFLYKKCKNVDQHFHMYHSLTVVGVIILVVSIFLQNYVYRLAEYFLIFNIFVIPIYFKVLMKKSSYILGLMLLGFISIYWLYWYFVFGAHGTSHYNWIF